MTFDSVHTLLFILILVLAAYIIYLHIQLIRKKIIIESIVRKISGIEKEMNDSELQKFVNEIQNFKSKVILTEDKLFEDDIIDFLFSNINESSTYIHYTMAREVADRIMIEGFRFVESFYKTALPITNDKLDLMIKHSNKKYYGDYIIVISISNEIVRYYSSEMENSGIKNFSFENVLTENPPEKNENSDNVFILSSHYIKGYVNFRTGDLVWNPTFDAGFSSPGFIYNIARLKELSPEKTP